MDTNCILLVEDSQDDIDLTLRAFRKNNILNKIVVLRDGAEALDFIFCRGAHAERDKQEPIAVIFLDLKLPKVSGLEVLRQLRMDPHFQYVPVIVLTSSREEQDRISSYCLGANSYVQKPVDFERFTNAARQLGLYWLVLNEPPPKLAQ
ncbi:response regulator [Rhizorhapis sp.]|uniref:response regulator n=1 Tax=Rhizorhapis sp. TaxID=1968842 RepID=UPI002B482664|nr:response regulator [Rhizorhapis sp.]HKR18011.1 response regulator [Rhizorhapis sp.]